MPSSGDERGRRIGCGVDYHRAKHTDYQYCESVRDNQKANQNG